MARGTGTAGSGGRSRFGSSTEPAAPGTETLVFTRDPDVRAVLERIAAASGTSFVHHDAMPSRSRWRSAAQIVVDLAMVPELGDQLLPRRDRVLVICRDAPTAEDLHRCVRLGAQETCTLEEIGQTLMPHLARTISGAAGRLIGVVGACGGAGASVFAAALATAAQQDGRATVLVDCDRWGAGLDVVMGLEGTVGVRWPDLAAPSGRLASDALHRALPGAARARGRIPVLTFDRDRLADIDVEVADVVLSSLREGGDTVVVDVPRIPTPAGDRAIQLADLVVLVTPADVRGCFAAQRQAEHLREHAGRLGLVVRGPSPGGLGGDDLAAVLDIPLLGAVRAQSRIALDLEAGRAPGADPRSPFGRACRAVLASVQTDPR